MEVTRLNALVRLARSLPAGLVAFAPAFAAPTPMNLAELGESPERYAELSVLEGGATIHRGVVSDPLSAGVPVAEGDWLESKGRGILQLGDGSRIAFGAGARIHVRELFGEAEGVREAELELGAGRIRVRVGETSAARIRIATPSGSVTLADDADVTLSVGPARTLKVWVNEGRAGFAGPAQTRVVLTGESLTAGGDPAAVAHTAEFDPTVRDDFGRWSEPRLAPVQGESAALVPQEIQYFTGGMDGMGQWVLLPRRGIWGWRPAKVADGWRPFMNGRWECCRGGLTWISSDPGGFATSHFGRWEWKAGLGWYWIPGAYYSPAWVAWKTAGGLFGWAPLDFHDKPGRWGQGPNGPATCWNIVHFRDLDAGRIGQRIDADAREIAAFDRKHGAGQEWFPGRVVVTPGEFHDPARIQAVVDQPGLLQERTATYAWVAQATTGRTIWRVSGTSMAGFESVVGPFTPHPILPGRGGWGRLTAFQDAFGPEAGPLQASGSREGTGASPLFEPS